jgi:hypothetical protein
MRKLVLIIIAFFAVVTFIRAFSSETGVNVDPVIEYGETANG